MPVTIDGSNTPTAGGVGYGDGTELAFTTAGTAGQVLTSNGSGAPSWATPAPSAGAITATATGTLPNGARVVVNTDGTVTAVSDTAGPGTVVGSPSTVYALTSSPSTRIASRWDAANSRIIVMFARTDLGDRPYVIAGQVNFSTNAITFGTAVELDTVGMSGTPSIAFDNFNLRWVFAWGDTSFPYRGKIRNATISGSTISNLSTLATFSSDYAEQVNAVWDDSAKVIVLVYNRATGAAFYTSAQTATYSSGSNTYSLGTIINFSGTTNGSSSIRAVYDAAAQKTIVAYRESTVNIGKSVVGTVSGGTLSFGTAAEIVASTNTSPLALYYDTASSKTVVITNLASVTCALVATISGTSISYGAPTPILPGTILGITPSVGTTPTGAMLILYRNNGSQDVLATVFGVVSGSATSWSSIANTALTTTSALTVAYTGTGNKKFVATYFDTVSSAFRASVLIQTPLGTSNFIGFSSAAYNSGETATINTVGSSNNSQTGLVAGNAYYVLTDGSLSTTAGSPSVFAGTALSTTKILVKG